MTVYVTQALQLGVHGYILKNASDELLVSALRAVHRNERLLSPRWLTTYYNALPPTAENMPADNFN